MTNTRPDRSPGGGSRPGTLHLGRVAGIPISMNWSVLLIAGLIAYALAASVLPAAVPGAARVAYWCIGIAAAILFMLSLLAHELAHAIVARRHGTRIEGITLWLLGGFTELDAEPEDSRIELRVALAGPATSLVLGAGFTAVSLLVHVSGAPALVSAPLMWLGLTNGLLGVFNLLPATPLDGGRVLRAAIWRRTGDRQRASLISARTGIGTGYLIVFLGLLEIVAASNVGGLWLMLIGWFILASSRAEAQRTRTAGMFSGVTVGEVMTPAPDPIPGWWTVQTVLERYVATRRGPAFPVADIAGEITGLVSVDQIRVLPADRRETTRIDRIARKRADIPSAAPSDPLESLVQRMSARPGLRFAFVFVEDHLVGIVADGDIAWAATVRRLGLHPDARNRAPSPTG